MPPMPSLSAIFGNKGKSKKADTPSSPRVAPFTLNIRDQKPTPAPLEAKIYVAFVATAMLDALGCPLEGEERQSHRIVDVMQPQVAAGREAGFWTADTSMMLCTAKGLATAEDRENSMVTQMKVLRDWMDRGVYSSTGRCFGIDLQVREAISLFTTNDSKPDHALYVVRNTFTSDGRPTSSSASLSRVLPISAVFWRDQEEARIQGRLITEITHSSSICKESCQLFAMLGAHVLNRLEMRKDEEKLSKLSILEEISNYPFENDALRLVLTLPFGLWDRPGEGEPDALEAWFHRHHPLLKLILRTQTSTPGASASFPYTIPTTEDLPTTDYAPEIVIAALYCFFATRTFEEGAIMAVNLCEKASTVGALYASLAAIWYGGEEGRDKGMFWTNRVRAWKAATQKLETVENVARRVMKQVRQEEPGHISHIIEG